MIWSEGERVNDDLVEGCWGAMMIWSKEERVINDLEA